MQEVTRFSKVVGDLFPNYGGSVNEVECPDQYVGLVAGLRGKAEFIRLPMSARPRNQACVILVLESPHKDEYDGERPVGPANGSTGRNIRSHVHGIPEAKDKGLILLNAVPFQCSLGKTSRVYRDAIFPEMWRRDGQIDFESRLKRLVVKRDVVLNCCTEVLDPASGRLFRELVDASILGLKLGCKVIRRSHPSSWRVRLGNEWAPRPS